MKFTIAALTILLASRCLGAETGVTVTGAKITEVGIFKARVIQQSNGQGEWKSDSVDNVAWVQATTNIPARAGIQFGFRYNIQGSPTNTPITLRVEHEQPQIRDPKTGATMATNSVQIHSQISKSYLLYTLENADLVPGKWKFRIFYQDTKLCEQGFMVGLPLYQYPRPVYRATNSISVTNP